MWCIAPLGKLRLTPLFCLHECYSTPLNIDSYYKDLYAYCCMLIFLTYVHILVNWKLQILNWKCILPDYYPIKILFTQYLKRREIVDLPPKSFSLIKIEVEDQKSVFFTNTAGHLFTFFPRVDYVLKFNCHQPTSIILAIGKNFVCQIFLILEILVQLDFPRK